MVAGNIDISCTAETKLDESFPNNRFVYQYNQSVYTGQVPSRRLNDFKIPSNIQIIPFEVNLRNEKSLVASIYNAPSQKNKYFL